MTLHRAPLKPGVRAPNGGQKVHMLDAKGKPLAQCKASLSKGYFVGLSLSQGGLKLAHTGFDHVGLLRRVSLTKQAV